MIGSRGGNEELRNERQMVRSDERRAAAVQRNMAEFQTAIEIDVIQIQQRKNAGIRAASNGALRDFGTIEMAAQQA